MIFSKLFGGGKTPAQTIGFDDLRRDLQAGAVELIDVREADEFRGGHAPGAKNMPLSRLDATQVPRDRRVALICLSGARSGAALRQLRQAGFDNVVHFQGGMSMWRTLGGPLAG